MTGADRCSSTSRSLGEPLGGTASVVRAWLLLEHPGPWGSDALVGGRLPAGLGPSLSHLADELNLKVLLIRRHHHRQRGPLLPAAAPLRSPERRQQVRDVRAFLAYTGRDKRWLEQVQLSDPRDVLELDLERLARGERTGLRAAHGPLFVVCTHGRHDPCCAERGRPVARALSARFPARTWESSHLGGDRFAANMVAFPHGLYFGRVPPERAAAIAASYRDGVIDLDCYRGRSCYPFPVQAAEVLLREREKITGVDAVRLLRREREGRDVTVRFAVAENGGTPVEHAVTVQTGHASPPRMLTCRDAAPSRPRAFLPR